MAQKRCLLDNKQAGQGKRFYAIRRALDRSSRSAACSRLGTYPDDPPCASVRLRTRPTLQQR